MGWNAATRRQYGGRVSTDANSSYFAMAIYLSNREGIKLKEK
jgi:hypothetical protein